MKVIWIILGILAGLCILAIVPLSVCGIVYGSIDIANGQITAKSLCFIIFGCIGLLGTGGLGITIDIGW